MFLSVIYDLVQVLTAEEMILPLSIYEQVDLFVNNAGKYKCI
jgi:hypothetical protein